MTSIQKSIFRTLCYSDIFDYPLTEEEIWQYLISNKIVFRDIVHTTLHTLPFVKQRNSFFYLNSRKKIITIRNKRERISEKKLLQAKTLVKWLYLIPTIQLLGVSGSVAFENAEFDDDIDLFIITKKQTLWLTRLLVLIVLEFFGLRRKRTQKKVSNKFCPNFFLDEQLLSFPKNKQDIYIAHEIIQMKLLYERDNMYQRFLCANKWITKFMANSLEFRISNFKFKILNKNDEKSKNTNVTIYDLIFLPFELIARIVQLWYMKRHRTTETTTDTIAAFHPIDYRGKILKLYKERLAEIGVSD